MKFEVDN